MSFRDDHEAALARVAALEEDVLRLQADHDRVKRDNERLEAENAELRKRVPKERPKPRPKPKPTRTPSERSEHVKKLALRIAGIAGAAGLFLVMVVGPAYVDCKNERAYDRELADYERQKARWHALIQFEDCARVTLDDLAEVKSLDAATTDPRHGRYSSVPGVSECASKLGALRDIPHLASVAGLVDHWLRARAAMTGPHAALAAYYSNRDWKDDDYAAAPKLWADWKPGVLAFEQATQAVFRAASPLVRSEIRAKQRAYEDKHGKDTAWWRIEIGFVRNELATTIPLGGTQEQMLAKAKELRALIATAPLELRRDLRQLVDELDWVERGEKDPGATRSHQLWDRTKDDGMGPVPKRPVQREGCGGD